MQGQYWGPPLQSVAGQLLHKSSSPYKVTRKIRDRIAISARFPPKFRRKASYPGRDSELEIPCHALIRPRFLSPKLRREEGQKRGQPEGGTRPRAYRWVLQTNKGGGSGEHPYNAGDSGPPRPGESPDPSQPRQERDKRNPNGEYRNFSSVRRRSFRVTPVAQTKPTALQESRNLVVVRKELPRRSYDRAPCTTQTQLAQLLGDEAAAAKRRPVTQETQQR